MGKILAWTLLIFSLVACYRNAPDPQFDESIILPPDSMVSLLTDIHLVEGIISDSKEKDSILKVTSSDALNLILTKHGLDQESFKENIRYYSYHAEELDRIYEKVINDLGKLESEMNAGKEEPAPDTAHLEKTAEQE